MTLMKYRKHLMSVWSAVVLVLLTIVSGIAAAEVETFEVGRDGYSPPGEQVAVPWPAMMLALLALIVVLGPAFLSSRRSHLD
jgi:hypothetical protein